MSKSAIISQPDQGVLVDISGCVDIEEAREHLVSSLEVSSQMPPGTKIDLKLGAILLNEEDVDQVIGLAQKNGVTFNQVFATNNQTKEALASRKLNVAKRVAASLSALIADAAVMEAAEEAKAAEDKAEARPATEDKKEAPAESGYAGPGCEEATTAPAAKAESQIPQVLYLKQNLRSGQSVAHKGHLVIFGDVNPGAEVVAEGDITVWGALRGIAHAGSNGNDKAEIRALRLHPIQLRIAHSIARSPDKPKSGALVPETARVVNGQIRIQANIPE